MSSNQPPILIHRSRSCTAFYKNDRVASTGRVDQAFTYGQGLRTAPQRLEDATKLPGVLSRAGIPGGG